MGLIVMRQLSLWLGLCGILGLGTLNLAAQPPSGTVTKGTVFGSWQEYYANSPGNSTNLTAWAVTCPGASSPCGYSNLLSADGYSSLGPSGGSPSDGWHNYNPNTTYTGSCTGNPYCNAQNYLNSLVICTTNCSGTQNLSFSLFGRALLNTGPFGSPVDLFRNPYGDNGYFLSIPGPAGFTISAPSGYYFSGFAFYWGSVDPWNAVKFTPSSGPAVTVYGTDLGFSFQDPSHTIPTSTPNMDSATIGFVPNLSTDPNWSSVTFTACSDPAGSLSGACYPAFEIDNLQFTLTTSATASVYGPNFALSPSATPEPSSMLLLGTAIAGLALLLRRKFPRQGR